MPLSRGKNSRGPYYRWGAAGDGGKQYFYIAGNARSREIARKKALLQGRAISRSKALRGRYG
jgi:hypothetical protein